MDDYKVPAPWPRYVIGKRIVCAPLGEEMYRIRDRWYGYNHHDLVPLEEARRSVKIANRESVTYRLWRNVTK